MKENNMLEYIKNVLENMPSGWVGLTTHRLDIYNESLAKTQFLDQFQKLFHDNNYDASALEALPTAYDYIRLGHPLSSVLEWAIANLNNLNTENVISFSSKTMPILAILRKNLLDHKSTQICYTGSLPDFFDAELLRQIYGYSFDLKQVGSASDISKFDGSTIFISQQEDLNAEAVTLPIGSEIDFYLQVQKHLGSILLVNGIQNQKYISAIQHVRRRETIAMTPKDSLTALRALTGIETPNSQSSTAHKIAVLDAIKKITGTTAKPLVASSGLSIQYAIMMGLVHYAQENYKGKPIKFIVPPNCYGGTNDQARRLASSIDNVGIVDLLVDGDNDMVSSLRSILDDLAKKDAVPYIIAEIPTNPRVEVPDLQELISVLSTVRKTEQGEIAVDPVFILDQTFCPNYLFLGEGEILSTVRAISYASGSKFPSGGQCTAGYGVVNKKAEALNELIETHLQLCDNEATDQQLEILAKQLPSMNQRIQEAYINTREFVNHIKETLPGAKINFVSEELAQLGFTPSVFSLDLPTKGDTSEERESFKRELNLKLINLMINEIPGESKYCVSYGQLHGCYWTVPATSTQGTTKERDKDYIARVSCSPDMDMDRHKDVFLDFVRSI